MSADEKRIRDFAYQIWESEGKPHGQEERHWEMARKLAEAEALSPNKKDLKKTTKPKLDGAGDAKPVASKVASKSAPKSAASPPPTPKAAPAKKPKAPGKPAAT